MQKLSSVFSTALFSLFLLTVVACSGGRKAAWDREADAAPKAQNSGDGDTQTWLSEADTAWAARADRAQLEAAIAGWEKVAAVSPDDWKLFGKIAKAYYLLGAGYMNVAGEDNVATLEKGLLAGEQAMLKSSSEFEAAVKSGTKVEAAVKLIPHEAQEAIYWYAANLGKFAVAKGFTTTLFYKDRIFAVMQHALNIDENFLHAAPHRYFGVFYAKAPGFAGGDINKSKTSFERALELGPDYFGTKVLMAEYYAVKTENRELFEKVLNEVINADVNVLPDLVPEQALEQAKAKAMLAKADELF